MPEIGLLKVRLTFRREKVPWSNGLFLRTRVLRECGRASGSLQWQDFGVFKGENVHFWKLERPLRRCRRWLVARGLGRAAVSLVRWYLSNSCLSSDRLFPQKKLFDWWIWGSRRGAGLRRRSVDSAEVGKAEPAVFGELKSF